MSGPTGASVVGRRAVAEAIRAGIAREVLVAHGAERTQGLRDVVGAAAAAGVPVLEVDRSRLDALATDHHGVVAFTRSPTRELDARALASMGFADDAVVVVLDGIMDPQNLGAAARSAEAAGAAALVSRTRRAAKPTPAAVRASAGALLYLPHARVANIPRTLERLKDLGFTVIGLDGAAPETIHDRPCPAGRVAIVIGSEGTGMARLTRERCDLLVSIAMHGRVASLNASASLAVALFAFVLPSRDR
jgi:23S rRNA (guanosine2251-2'-O)-methyltransferase